MRLTLAIENFQNLPDGGPLSVTVSGQRGIDIGRDQYLDWTLPDPSRQISGKHCEVRVQNGEYFLYDISTNGTFLNGQPHRMQSPYRLRTGDRLSIGQYLIAVTVETAAGVEPPQPFVHRPATYEELWNPDGAVAPPISPKELMPPAFNRPVHGDWLEQAASVLPPVPSAAAIDPSLPQQRIADRDVDWAPVVPKAAPPVEAPPPIPRPRHTPAPEKSTPWLAEPPAPVEAPHEPLAAPTPPVASTRPPSPFAPASEEAGPALEPSASHAAPQPSMAPASDASVVEFLRRVALAAGMAPEVLTQQNSAELAEKLGAVLRLMVGEMKQLLDARSEAKRLARNPNQTMIQALGNNPLKFSPSVEDALRVMFGPPSRSYLDAQRAFAEGFANLKMHHVRTYAAMQQAVRMIAEDLDPAAIEAALTGDSGLASMIGSRKARLWEAYVARWQAKTQRHDDGLVDVFMLYFADCYDRADSGR